MVKNEVLVLVFTLFLSYTLVKVNSKIIAKITNLECFPNLDWVNMSCKLKAVSWKKSLANIDAELKKDINKVMVHAQVFKRYNSYQPFPIKANFEFCSILRGSGINNIFTPLVRRLINRYSNVNHTCPYHKGDKIFAKDLDWTPSDFMDVNLAGGAGRYRLDINVYGNGAKARGALIVGHADFTEE